MQTNKVIIRFKDGMIMKGNTSDFFPNKIRFHLNRLDGKIEEIDTDTLKAVFFVKDFEGNKEYQKKYEDTIHGAGRKIEVEFTDGEIISGYALGYSPDRPGFFITPADLTSNNERIFVVKSATISIKFL
ncbi:MAG: hypothetical protein OES64_13370 [Desulfobacteraceae bacterium]|jgi:Family of unknown function (DUF6982)|nr:hypothetical protein [Desulfobacteraceae bacterium]MDH3723229.1 hypothetical protein [Desulfobacteraceae bacterium]MDH3838853.1 hypothetical protein [Desulfobacteraceae bacterium]MDH3874253.1 hypothetical protein [Desulfobacteraceae bacterium]MDH3882538.1 hypothetical protein [Desulfobacteraceae bacterium]